MGVLSNLNCKVFDYFEDISKIPHGSGNTKAISEYCIEFAKKHSLEYYSDDLNNVIIYKKASKGYEGYSPVIIQGHLDMVCEKDPDIDFDFEKDALNLAVDGDFIYAKGTTLGGDDGVAIAMALAILDDDTLDHPDIEALFTVDEETGMYGAEGLDATKLKGNTLLNVDSEAEGVFTVGCAGGARCSLERKVTTKKADHKCYTVKVSGLIGGHSGIEINKGRLNANFVLVETLCEINKHFPVFISDIGGGSKDNVITRESSAVVCVDASLDDIKSVTDSFKEKIFIETDPGLNIEVSKTSAQVCFDEKTSECVFKLFESLKQGILKMSPHIEGLPQTSQNLGVVKLENDVLKLTYSVRSAVNSERDETLENIRKSCDESGFDYSQSGVYPAWEYREDSPLRDTVTEVFKNSYGKEPIVEVIHAGLECGILGTKIQNLDAVSFGPDLFDIHTSRERMSISSVKRTFDFLCEILRKI